MTPLYADLALRSSEVLGNFATVFPLPHRYGDLSKTQFTLGKLTDTLYVVADHAMEKITEVFEGGQKLSAWEWFNRADVTGRVVCYVRLGQPASAINSLISASGYGKISKQTGALLTNPAEIIRDLVAINGRDANYFLFYQACNRRNIKFAGSFTEVKNIRLYIKQILGSIGALLVGDSIIFEELSAGYVKTIYSYGGLSYKASLSDRCGRVKVAYAHDEAKNSYRAFVVVGARKSKYTTERIVYCKWLTEGRLALAYANTLAAKYSGEFYEVNAEIGEKVKTGEWIRLDSSFFTSPILITEARPSAFGTNITGILTTVTNTHLELLSYTSALPDKQREALELDFKDGVLTITIYKENNVPFVGAFVSLDKGTPRQTDVNGKVFFSTTKGGHILDIAAIGFNSIDNLPIDVQ